MLSTVFWIIESLSSFRMFLCHTRTHTYTYTQTNTRARTHTHTHTHSHINICVWVCVCMLYFIDRKNTRKRKKTVERTKIVCPIKRILLQCFENHFLNFDRNLLFYYSFNYYYYRKNNPINFISWRTIWVILLILCVKQQGKVHVHVSPNFSIIFEYLKINILLHSYNAPRFTRYLHRCSMF
jgi:hypothetical protein